MPVGFNRLPGVGRSRPSSNRHSDQFRRGRRRAGHAGVPADPDANADTNPSADASPNTHTNSDPNADASPNTHTNSDPNASPNTNANSDPNANSDSNANSDPNAHTPTPTPAPYAGSFNSVAASSQNGYAAAPTAFSGGSLQAGVFTAPIGSGMAILSPLTPGVQTSVTGQTPIGAVTGTAFLSSDSTFFFADLTSVSSPSQVALIQGGIPITAAGTSIGTTNQVLAFNIQQDPALGSTIPFIRNATGGNLPGAVVSPLYLVTPSGTLAQDPAGQTTPRTLQASLAVNGSDVSQQSVIVTNIGLVAGASPQLVAALRGTSLVSATGTPVLINAAFGSLPDGVGGGLYGTSGLTGVALGATSPFASETPLSGPSTGYNFNHPAIATTTPAGVGPGLGTNPSAGFIPSSGFFGGAMNSTATPGAPYPITGTTSFTQTGPATFSANFTSDTLPLTAASTGGLTNLTLTFGGNASGTPDSTIIDGNIYGAVEGAGGATLSDSINPPQPGTQQLYLLSAAAAPLPNSLLPGGVLCSTCAFTQWGYWGGDVTSNFGAPGRADLGHFNFWVAGQPIPVVNMPATGIGTYNGGMIGSVNNNGAQYIATGNFTNTFDFGSPGASGCAGPGCGTFTINTFDGKTGITGPIGPLNGSTYKGNNLIGPNIAGAVNGGFFGPANAPGAIPPETAGNFVLQNTGGSPYQAAGVFAGHQ